MGLKKIVGVYLVLIGVVSLFMGTGTGAMQLVFFPVCLLNMFVANLSLAIDLLTLGKLGSIITILLGLFLL